MDVSEKVDRAEPTGGIGGAERYPYPTDRLKVHHAHLVNPKTGEQFHISGAGGSTGDAMIRRSYEHRPFETIAQVRTPDVTFIVEDRELTVPETPIERYPIGQVREQPKGITERQRAQHRERVAQARKAMPNPQASLSDLVAKSLGVEGLRVVERYLDDRLGVGDAAESNDAESSL